MMKVLPGHMHTHDTNGVLSQIMNNTNKPLYVNMGMLTNSFDINELFVIYIDSVLLPELVKGFHGLKRN